MDGDDVRELDSAGEARKLQVRRLPSAMQVEDVGRLQYPRRPFQSGPGQKFRKPAGLVERNDYRRMGIPGEPAGGYVGGIGGEKRDAVAARRERRPQV